MDKRFFFVKPFFVTKVNSEKIVIEED